MMRRIPHLTFILMSFVFLLSILFSQDKRPNSESSVWESMPTQLGQVIRSGNEKLGIGFAIDSEQGRSYSITFSTGLEPWEDGKKSNFRHEIWMILCNYPAINSNPPQTYCSLDRQIIDDWGKTIPPNIGSRQHYLSENTLQLGKVDWENGILNMTAIYDDNSKTEIDIRFKNEKSVLYLESFRALNVGRTVFTNSLSVIEYKIPKYTYILNIPLEMKGLYDAGLKNWDQLFNTLSESDQKKWQILSENGLAPTLEQYDMEMRKRMKLQLPQLDYDSVNDGKQIPTDSENKAIDRIFEDILKEWMINHISNSDLSSEAKKNLSNYVERFLSSQTSASSQTNTTVPQEGAAQNLKFDLDVSSLSYKLPPHTKFCLPETRNDCSSGACEQKKPAVFVLYDEVSSQIYRCDNNPCSGFSVIAEESGFYINLTPVSPNGSMYKISSDNRYVETVSLGLDLIMYEGKCSDIN
jgi:hypothetical protein